MTTPKIPKKDFFSHYLAIQRRNLHNQLTPREREREGLCYKEAVNEEEEEEEVLQLDKFMPENPTNH
jgi:hypothetical protein